MCCVPTSAQASTNENQQQRNETGKKKTIAHRGQQRKKAKNTRNSHIISHIARTTYSKKQIKAKSVTKIENASRNNYPNERRETHTHTHEKQKQTNGPKRNERKKRICIFSLFAQRREKQAFYSLFFSYGRCAHTNTFTHRPYADGVLAIYSFVCKIILLLLFFLQLFGKARNVCCCNEAFYARLFALL